jgi:DNA-binding response OmpR family regulator
MGSTTRLVGRCVLVVEDEPLIALGLKEAFEAEGASVYLASNSNGALRFVRDATLSAAVLDFGSEGDSGSTLRRTLRAYGVPFLYYTGVDDLDERSLGAPIISKPASAEVLITTLTKLLSSSPSLPSARCAQCEESWPNRASSLSNRISRHSRPESDLAAARYRGSFRGTF